MPHFKNVIEFRHHSWFDEEVYQLLSDHNISFCSMSSPEFPDDMIVTNEVAYVRFHGAGKDWYDYYYSEDELKKWHQKIKVSGAKGSIFTSIMTFMPTLPKMLSN